MAMIKCPECGKDISDKGGEVSVLWMPKFGTP